MSDWTHRPTIHRPCKRCKVTEDEVRGGYVVVSPRGVAHHGADYGMTVCGSDATGDNWWWPL